MNYHRCSLEPTHEQDIHFEHAWRKERLLLGLRDCHVYTDIYVAMHLQFDTTLIGDEEDDILEYALRLIDGVNAVFQMSTPAQVEWASFSVIDMKQRLGFSSKRAQAVYDALHGPIADTPRLRFVLRKLNVDVKNQQLQKGYFNIWVSALETGLLGFGVFPFGDDISEYGAVVDYRTTDKALAVFPRFNSNKTMVHEIGHCMGLFHTFTNPSIKITDQGIGPRGETELEYGDGAAMTPHQMVPTYGNPLNTGLSSDDSILNSHGECVAISNVMNYVDDDAMMGLTQDQVDRMHYFWDVDIKDKLVTQYKTHDGVSTYMSLPEALEGVDVVFGSTYPSPTRNTWLSTLVVTLLIVAIIVMIILLVVISGKSKPSSVQNE
jgi:hypothetical protein